MILLFVLAALSPPGARALSLEKVGNFVLPTYVTSDPGEPDRLFVVERSGRIHLVENGEKSLFLDIESLVLSSPDDGAIQDHGLYSMAFSPEFATDSLFYVIYSSADDPGTTEQDESGDWHIAEFTADGDVSSPASRREVLAVAYPPGSTHYGGQLQFGPDDYLYASTGDRGPQGDPDGNAQNLANLFGKILRIDPQPGSEGAYGIPDGNPFAGPTPGEDEIWSYGLRNPWRFSFDQSTGDLWIGDVGYSTMEEIDFAAAPDPGKGANFGWNCREGTRLFSATPPCDAPQDLVDPVFEYEHVGGNCSVTGGYVVRDPALPDLFGRYLYADWCFGELRSLSPGPQVLDRPEGLCLVRPTSFGEDASGRIYVTDYTGPVYRLAAGGSAGACATDTTPPDTQIDSGPTGTITTDQAGFTFSGDPSSDTAKIQCRIDSDPFADCSSPQTFTGLSDGPHTAEFRAEDEAGNQDQTPATRTFTVDTTAPDTRIDSGPTGTITTDQAAFTFSGDPASDTAKIQCRIDSGSFADCASPKTFTGLADGLHTAEFRAEDAAGNQDATPATLTFAVDTTVYRAKISKVAVKGPRKVKRGKKATYRVKITNSGNAAATGVKLNVKGRGVKSREFAGRIAAGETRKIKVRIRPKKAGKVKVSFRVRSRNAGGKVIKKKIRVRK